MSSSSIDPRNTAWLTRLRSNDESALGELMDVYFDSIASLAFHYVRVYDTARDVAQDTFIRCWDRRHEFHDDTVLLHYLRRIARLRALEVVRKEGRASAYERQAVDVVGSLRAHEVNDGVATVERGEFQQLILQIANTFSPRVREVILFYYSEGLSPNEIADLLEVAPSTVYGQLRKAMGMFMEGIAGRWP